MPGDPDVEGGDMAQTPVVVVIASTDAMVVAAVAAAATRARLATRHVTEASELSTVAGRLPHVVLVLDQRLPADGASHAHPLEQIPALIRRASVAGQGLAVVVVGLGQGPDEALEARRAGAFHCMVLPLSPGALDQVLAAARGRLEAVDPSAEPPSTGPLIPLDPSRLPPTVPAAAGVLVLHDEARRPLWVEWTAEMTGRLQALAWSPEMGEARFVAVHPTTDPTDAAKIFDRLVNVTGRFPRLMRTAPTGARHRSDAEVRGPATEAGRVTGYGRSTDSRLASKLRDLFLSRPRDRETLEWLAFALYSNDMLDEAVATYDDLLQGWPVRQEYLFYCANAESKRGRVDTARDLWRRAADMDETSVIGAKSRARASRTIGNGAAEDDASTARDAEHQASTNGAA